MISETLIENPERFLSLEQKADITKAACGILKATTGNEHDSTKTARYLFGLADRGRSLCLFKEGEEIIGFSSFHLLNDDQGLIKYQDRTTLHVGSVHILPRHQGGAVWFRSILDYLDLLPEELYPKYFEGLTQSPRLLKLATHYVKGRIWPNIDQVDNDGLEQFQEAMIPKVFKEHTTKGSVISGLNEQVYDKVISYQEGYDSWFYNQLGVDVSKGDFLHFVGIAPRRINGSRN